MPLSGSLKTALLTIVEQQADGLWGLEQLFAGLAEVMTTSLGHSRMQYKSALLSCILQRSGAKGEIADCPAQCSLLQPFLLCYQIYSQILTLPFISVAFFMCVTNLQYQKQFCPPSIIIKHHLCSWGRQLDWITVTWFCNKGNAWLFTDIPKAWCSLCSRSWQQLFWKLSSCPSCSMALRRAP